MTITLGGYTLSLQRQPTTSRAAPENAPPLSILTGETSLSRALFNRHDNPRENLQYIRETVSACMHARSEAIGRGRFHAFARSRGGAGSMQLVPVTSEHPLERLLRDPNPFFDLSDLLELSSQWLDATGNALWLKVRNIHGEPVEIWPLAALSFEIEKDADEMPVSYRFLPGGIRIPAADIIHIRRSDIRTAPFYGHALLSDLLDTARADTAVRLFQQRFFENDAVPRAVLRWPQGALISQEQMDDIRRRWEMRYGAATNAGKIGILPDGGDIHVLGTNARELDFAQSKKDLRDAIRQAFRVPRILLGDVEDVNLSNAETSYMVFLRDVVDHALGKHARALTRSLANEFDAELEVIHEKIIPEPEERTIGRLRELKHALTLDEQRAMLSLPPLASGVGSAFMIEGRLVDANFQPLNAL